MNKTIKLIRITTVPISLKVLLQQQLRFMSNHFEVLAISSGGKLLDEVAEQEGVKTFAVEMTRAITPVDDLKALWKLYSFLKKEKPAIVHTHTPKAGVIGMMAAKMAGVPLRLHTVAGLPLMESRGIKRKLLESVERLTYRCATKIYPNSKGLAQFIIQNKFCKTEKLKVLGNGSSNGINLTFFQITPALESTTLALRTKYNLFENSFVFVFVGRLVRDKGIEELIAAFCNLKSKYKHIKLLLVGQFEPELDPIAEETVSIINTDKDIISTGFQKDVRPFYMLSNVLAFPSYREGFPNVPMQAGSFNLPSIVTNINGCNEIIEHHENGLIIPVKNAKALENAMETLLTDKALYERMRGNARKMIQERYDQKHIWNLLLQEYQEQLKKHAIVS